MKVTTPEEMEKSNIDDIVELFELEFQKEKKDCNYYHLVIRGEYSRRICDQIESLYTQAGWKSVTCKTSSENGERPGLTGLQLYRNT